MYVSEALRPIYRWTCVMEPDKSDIEDRRKDLYSLKTIAGSNHCLRNQLVALCNHNDWKKLNWNVKEGGLKIKTEVMINLRAKLFSWVNTNARLCFMSHYPSPLGLTRPTSLVSAQARHCEETQAQANQHGPPNSLNAAFTKCSHRDRRSDIGSNCEHLHIPETLVTIVAPANYSKNDRY